MLAVKAAVKHGIQSIFSQGFGWTQMNGMGFGRDGGEEGDIHIRIAIHFIVLTMKKVC